MIRYRLTLLAGGYNCTVQGEQLVIGLDGGRPSFEQSTGWVNIGDIEVYVSGDDSEFSIVGKERTAESTTVENLDEMSSSERDPGRFLGSSTGTLAGFRTLELGFASPQQLDSEHQWVFGDYTTPPLKLTVKVKRQEVSGDCASWPTIFAPQLSGAADPTA